MALKWSVLTCALACTGRRQGAGLLCYEWWWQCQPKHVSLAGIGAVIHGLGKKGQAGNIYCVGLYKQRLAGVQNRWYSCLGKQEIVWSVKINNTKPCSVYQLPWAKHGCLVNPMGSRACSAECLLSNQIHRVRKICMK